MSSISASSSLTVAQPITLNRASFFESKSADQSLVNASNQMADKLGASNTILVSAGQVQLKVGASEPVLIPNLTAANINALNVQYSGASAGTEDAQAQQAMAYADAVKALNANLTGTEANL